MINLLIKLEYLFQKEFDLRKETIEVRLLIQEQARIQEEEERQKKIARGI